MSETNENNVTNFSVYREERLTWPYGHVTETQIKSEYNKIKKVASDLQALNIEIPSSLSAERHHIPGFILYSWIFGWLVECLHKEYGVVNRFCETDINFQYLQPVTQEVLQQGLLRISYQLANTIDQPEKSLVVLNFEVKIFSAHNQILAQTPVDKFFTLIGPCPQIFIEGESKSKCKYPRH